MRLWWFVLLSLASCASNLRHGRPDHFEETAPDSVSPSPSRALPRTVVTGTIEAVTDDLERLVRALRARVASDGGQVSSEEVTAGEAPRATMRVRLAPRAVTPFVEWLATASEIRARRLAAEDVSLGYVDEELALHNLRITLVRLEALAERGGKLADVLEIERELTRVRGEVERLEGSHRALADRIALATLEVFITPGEGALPPRAHFHLVASAAMLAFADSQGRPSRAGGGLALMFGRSASIELQLFAGGPETAWLLAGHTALYSELMGGGRRRFFNPYLGLLAGGGHLDGSGLFTIGAEAGLELYRGPQLFVEVALRAQELLYSNQGRRNDGSLLGSFGVGVPF
jgi:hypothetical protein